MVKKQATRCHKKCTTHLFTLKPLSENVYINREVNYLYCPIQKQFPTYPFLNRDFKSYTPCFILEQNRHKYQEYDERYRSLHRKMMIDNIYPKTQLLVPKPKSKNMYCHVCNNHYDDYYCHIRNPSHKANVHRSKWNKYICELANKVNKNSNRSVTLPIIRETNLLEDFSNDSRSEMKEQESKNPSTYVLVSDKPSLEYNHSKKNGIREEKGVIIISDSDV